jgi:hypothetical protein
MQSWNTNVCSMTIESRNMLELIDWQLLRGVPIEDFLADALILLGYTVERTAVSGEQGVDLIATQNHRRINVVYAGRFQTAVLQGLLESWLRQPIAS